MKLLAPFAAIIAAAAAGHIYTTQPAEAYSNSAEIYQSALEHQQQGLYSDQSQTFSGHSGQELHSFAGENDHEQAYGHSRPAGEKSARILSYVSDSDGHGYQYAYETENGIKAQEAGQIAGHEKGTEAHGAYSYKGDDGQVYTVTYTADEHGFHAQGAHLPTPPPIPEAIAKSLEQNAKDEAAGIFDDGKYSNQHESHAHEQPIEIQENSGHQQTAQAYQYETAAIQHEYQPIHQLNNHQGLQQGSQSAGQHHQFDGHHSGQQQSQLPSHQSGQVSYQGHQPSGFQLLSHQSGFLGHQQVHQGHQLGGFQPSGYHAMNVPADGYRKH